VTALAFIIAHSSVQIADELLVHVSHSQDGL